jgi:hypothetical protein
MSLRTWDVALTAIIALLLGLSAIYVERTSATQAERTLAKPSDPSVALAQVSNRPRIVFRSTRLGELYGRVAMVPLSDPSGPRAFTSESCDRVFAAHGRTLCLASERGLVTTYAAQVLAGPRFASPSYPAALARRRTGPWRRRRASCRATPTPPRTSPPVS